jgi:hypothetical protein
MLIASLGLKSFRKQYLDRLAARSPMNIFARPDIPDAKQW